MHPRSVKEFDRSKKARMSPMKRSGDQLDRSREVLPNSARLVEVGYRVAEERGWFQQSVGFLNMATSASQATPQPGFASAKTCMVSQCFWCFQTIDSRKGGSSHHLCISDVISRTEGRFLITEKTYLWLPRSTYLKICQPIFLHKPKWAYADRA